MGLVNRLVRALRDRRHSTTRVRDDRRRPPMKEADKKLGESLDRLVEAIRGPQRYAVANDSQQVVIFATWREICQSKGPEIGGVRLCRHRNHPDAANTEMRICDEMKCPTLNAALKGAA